jgi:hypothetical protein
MFEQKEMNEAYDALVEMGIQPHVRKWHLDSKMRFIFFELNECVFIIQNATCSRPYSPSFTLGVELVPSTKFGSCVSVGSYPNNDSQLGTSMYEIIKLVKSILDDGHVYRPHLRGGIPTFFTTIEQFNKRQHEESKLVPI